MSPPGRPTRRGASNNRSVENGFLLFQPADSTLPTHPQQNALHFGCATCHGNKGQGGSTTYTINNAQGQPEQVTWDVPALNTVLLRYTSDTVLAIITYGRANTPMPAWGVAGGGPMNAQQLGDLVAYIQTIQLTPAQAKQEAAQYGNNGQAIFNAYCARCHTHGYSYGQPGTAGGGAYGPNLTGGSEITPVPQSGRPGRLRHRRGRVRQALRDPWHRPDGAGQPSRPCDPGSGRGGRRDAVLQQLADARADQRGRGL